jgi:hypothetical protein
MKKWIFCLLAGLAMLTLSTGAGVNDDTVRCDGEIMSPGDVCEYRNRSGGHAIDSQTYDEMKANTEAGQRTFNSWGRWALLGGGLVLTGLGAWGAVRHRRRQKAAAPGTADPHVQQQAAESAPAPQTGPQWQYQQQQYAPHAYPARQQPRREGQPAVHGDFGPGADGADDVTQRLPGDGDGVTQRLR